MPDNRERVALYDTSDLIGRVIGEASRHQVRARNLPHASSCVLIRDSSGRRLLHRRPAGKDPWPSLVTAGCAGMIRAGETPLVSARRELTHQLGINSAELTEVASLWYRDQDRHYLAYLYELVWDGSLGLPNSQAWWVTPTELDSLVRSDDPVMAADSRWLLRRLNGVKPDPGPWTRRDPVLVRFGRQGRARAVRTARVLVDDANGLVLWVPAGTATVQTVTSDGRDLRTLPVSERADAQRVRQVSRWAGPGIYQWFPVRYDGWSLWSFFSPSGEFRGWYGNLESAPLRRLTLDGTRYVDVSDRALDVSIPLIGGQAQPRWKDQDEFIAYTGLPGRWGPDQVEQILAQGRALWHRATQAQWPFDGHWIIPPLREDPLHLPVPMPVDWDLPHLGGP